MLPKPPAQNQPVLKSQIDSFSYAIGLSVAGSLRAIEALPAALDSALANVPAGGRLVVIAGYTPTIQLRTGFSGDLAEEGKLARLTAEVGDDVQVRNVEFYVDGVKVATDGNFPFEHRFVTPVRSAKIGRAHV